MEEYRLSHDRLSPVQRFFTAICRTVLVNLQGKLTIFVDELDTVRSLPFPTAEFFGAIREIYNRRSEEPELGRVTFCLLGVATPSELIEDSKITPFNIGRRIDLEDFQPSGTTPLARGLARAPAAAAELIDRICHWTHGHHYLTQKLCRAVLTDESIQTTAALDDLCSGLFFTASAFEQDDNLIFVRERILRSGSNTAELLNLFLHVRSGGALPQDDSDPLIMALRLSGIVRIENGALKVRNRIYEKVFDPKWIQNQLSQVA